MSLHYEIPRLKLITVSAKVIDPVDSFIKWLV